MQTDEEKRKWRIENKEIKEKLAETEAAHENATQKHKEHSTSNAVAYAASLADFPGTPAYMLGVAHS